MRKKGNFFGRAFIILGESFPQRVCGGQGARRGDFTLRLFQNLRRIQGKSSKALLDGKPVLVDFGSNKCIPCRQLRPILKEVAQEFSGKAHVLVIDVFQHQALAREHRIHLIPTLIFFNSRGKEIFRRSGVWDKASIAKKLKDAGTI